MAGRWGALTRASLLVLLAPLALTACFFLPGKFVSALTIRADRSFTFTYVGEIVAVEPDTGLDSSSGESAEDKAGADAQRAQTKAEQDAKNREAATALAREAGYRRVEYRGDNVFWVDYALTGKLTHGFAYPFNSDVQMVFPFVAIELRGKDTVRIRAPGFAQQDSEALTGTPSTKAPPSKLDGTFTLTTDAEIVSQNNEAGATTADGMKTVRWRATPLTKDAPMAVLRVAPLP